jgi:hypothetical protein
MFPPTEAAEEGGETLYHAPFIAGKKVREQQAAGSRQ